MKQKLFTLLLLSAIGLVSCRKDKNEPDIKEYDQQQIQNYISANGLTGMKRDTSNGDTTGIYYQVLTTGTGPAVDYSDLISFVYTLKTFDNKFTAFDTVLNHYYGYLGHASPNGLMLSLHNILKNKGAKVRLLIPSHLGYGVSGAGSGSSSQSSRINGNQCLDYTVELINSQVKYDDMVIQNYMTANSLSGYTKITSGVDSGLYYKITTQGTGSAIGINSSITCNYTGKLMNNTVFDDHSTTTYTFTDLAGGGYIKGFADGLQLAKGGGGISLLIPSKLAYGTSGSSTGAIPANACLRFDITNIVVN